MTTLSGASEQYINRHKNTDFIVALCVDLYVSCRCGLRTTAQIVEILKKHFKDFQPEEIPSCNSIANRVQKSEYTLYEGTGSKEFPEGDVRVPDMSVKTCRNGESIKGVFEAVEKKWDQLRRMLSATMAVP